VSLLMAVLGARAEYPLDGRDVFIAAVGGISISEPAADLAIALALASADTNRPVKFDLVVFGELGLAGELRMVPGADRRLAEAQRAGFTRAIVPASTPDEAIPRGMEVHQVRTLFDAVCVFFRDFTDTMPSWSTVAASR
jgi:DNA repair protein RadA/Sms